MRDLTVMGGPGTGGGSWNESRRARLITELIKLSLLVAPRSGDDEQTEARIELYADALSVWPEHVALEVIAEAPRRSVYWPSWKELEDLRLELHAHPESRSAPEHKPFDRLPAPHMHAPFSKAEWDGFCETMRKLRDPDTPMVARDVLLRLGEGIEARQLHNARRNGWV